MSRDSLRLVDYLQHIVQAAGRIQKYVENLDEEAFKSSDIVQDAVIRNFEVIGEASSNIMKSNEGFIEQHPELPLRFAYDMRNQLSHGYFNTDLSIVWRTATRNIPAQGNQIKLLIEGLSRDDADQA